MRARTPYEISFTEANLDAVQLEVYIYTGTQDTDKGSVLYTLEGLPLGTDPISGAPKVIFDVAPLVRDYFRDNISFDNDYSTFVYWLSYVSTRTVSGTLQTPDTIEHIKCFFGYHENEQGAQYIGEAIDSNALFGSSLDDGIELYERSVINKPYGVGLTIPVSWDISDIMFLKDGDVLYSVEPSGLVDTETDDAIQYISDANLINESFENYVKRNEGYLIPNNDYKIKQLCNAVSSCLDYDEIVVNNIGTDENATNYNFKRRRVIDVRSYNEEYNWFKVTFINRCGAFEDLFFVGQSKEKLKVNRSDFKRNIRENGTYDTTKHHYRSLNVNGRRSMTLNSGWVDESLNAAFEELLLSEFVWLNKDGKTKPINIKTSDLSLQKQNDEGLINYTIEVELSYDVLNNFQ